MPSHTIKVFTRFLHGAVDLQYIHHQEDHPTEDSPGNPASLMPREKIRWKSMNGVALTVEFENSPFTSGATLLPLKRPKGTTEYQTVARVPPDPVTGNNPSFKYSVTVTGVPTDDPDLVVDLGGGGGGGGHSP